MKPMLAKPFDARHANRPGFIQPKLDGVRLFWTGAQALSRNGKQILGVPKLVETLERSFLGVPLDGELYAHGAAFEKIVSSVRRSKNIEEDERVEFWVYDHPIRDCPFGERFSRLHYLLRAPPPRIVCVETRPAPDPLFDVFACHGYEGTMWRAAEGLYAFGKRSSDLLKLKGFEDAEFKVVNVVELSRKEKVIVPTGTPGAKQYADGSWYKDGEATAGDTLGALVCETAEGKRFEVGSGFTDEQRRAFWLRPPTGVVATIKYQNLTENGIPRFPVFKAMRDYE